MFKKLLDRFIRRRRAYNQARITELSKISEHQKMGEYEPPSKDVSLDDEDTKILGMDDESKTK